jgi:hypothetical protein
LPGVFDRLLAGRRRRRAQELLDLGNPVGLDFDFRDAGPVPLFVLSAPAGPTLVMKIIDLKPVGTGGAGFPERRPVGVRNVIDGCRSVARIAADAGYDHLRISGQRRSHRRNRLQTLEFDLAELRGERRRRG